MSLSASTLALFILLVPGLIFRYCLYQGSLVKRPFFASSTIYSSIAVILYSTVVFIAFFLLVRTGAYLFNKYIHVYQIPVGIAEFNGNLYIFNNRLYQGRRYEIINFLIAYPFVSIIFFIAICSLSWLLAVATRKLSLRFQVVGRMMYGPLAALLSRPKATILTCFVLSKVSDGNKRLVYAGFPSEISLREGNNIDHIILQNPEKFFMSLSPRDAPKTSFQRARPISTIGYSRNYMYISGSEIENVHFEGFYFDDDSNSILKLVKKWVATLRVKLG